MNEKYKGKLKKQFLKEALKNSKRIIEEIDDKWEWGSNEDYFKLLDEWEHLMDFTFKNIDRIEKWM